MVVTAFRNDAIDGPRTFGVSPSFSIREVDGHRGDEGDGTVHAQKPLKMMMSKPPQLEIATPKVHPQDDPTLGPVLSKFVGTFSPIGSGLNTIFRPRSKFDKKVARQQDNLLEINLTVETLQFLESKILGKIPNRGFDNQEDIDLTGIPYQQTVTDQLNEATGLANLGSKKIDMHFEQGLIVRTPPTTSPNTQNKATLCRMGSIPHGVTINAQDVEPTAAITGPPTIEAQPIMPFSIGGTQKDNPVSFNNIVTKGEQPEEKAVDKTPFFRKPQNMTKFVDNKTITMDALNDPNTFLRNVNAIKPIGSHFKFTLSTQHPVLKGGGTANIAFLVDGNKPTVGGTGNAKASKMDCTYWVSTIKHKITIPKGDWSTQDPPLLKPADDKDDVPGPQFLVRVGKNITVENQVIEATSTQIQYSQNVILDFGPISWPHVSVASLAPALPVEIKADDPQLAKLK